MNRNFCVTTYNGRPAVYDKVARAAYAAVNRDVMGARKGARFADTGVDEFDATDTVYMYFVFEEIAA